MPHPLARRLVVALATCLPLLAAAATLPAYREFGDWTVACDNVGDCEARGYHDREDVIAMRFVRAAATDSAPVLTLHGLAPDAGDGLRFGTSAWSPPPGVASRQADEGADGAAETRLTLAGLAALRAFAGHAHRADLVSSGDRDASLAGFDAAMLFIDDVQGRIGTRSAIARPGTSAARASTARPLPTVRARPLPASALSAADARRYVAALPVGEFDCDDLRDDEPTVQPLSPDEVIALRPCNRGAYQTAYIVFRGRRDDPKHARVLELPYPPGFEADRGVLLEASLDAATGRLSMFAKGRGLADCGETGEWAFDGRGFVPTAFARLDRCGWPVPGDYPVLWRTRVVLENAR
jgi:hypothetical protein